jgi:hypothetical protein
MTTVTADPTTTPVTRDVAATSAPATTAPSTLGRSIIVWVVLCTLGMLGAVAVAVTAVTGDVVDGLVVGAFAAAWGGPGFGVMFGSAAHAVRQERDERAAAAAARRAR